MAKRIVRRLDVATAMASLVAMTAAAGASGATFYVDGGVPASGDCLSPAAACKTLADAIAKERATGEADTINVATGSYAESINLNTVADGGLTIAGAGAGSDPGANTLFVSTSGASPVVQAQAPNTMLTLRGIRVVAKGSATGAGIAAAGPILVLGRADAPVVVDMANAGSSADAITAGAPSGGTSVLDHVTVGGAWTGSALFGGANTTVADSRLTAGPTGTGTPALLAGPGATLFRRSVLQVGNPNYTGPAVSSTDLDVTLDSSEALGGGGVFFSPGGAGKSHTLTVASSTVDAGVLGNRDAGAGVTVEANGAGAVATGRVDGSILMEAPKAAVSSGGSATLDCTATDVAGTTQAADPSHGAIACATGSNGNSFTPSLADLFANPAPDYTLKPGSGALDSVPESAIVLPAGVTPSATDLAGAARVVNGVDTCAAPIRDRGALELGGHAGIAPAATIAAPAGAVAGVPAAFGGSAPNQPAGTPLTFGWGFSDGATATGPDVAHAFPGPGAASATLTVTAPGDCVGTATAPLTVAAALPVLDAIADLKLRPRAFFAGRTGPSVVTAARRKVGTVVSYTGTQPATTRFTVQRRKAGRRQGKRCRKPRRANRHGRRCHYYKPVGRFSHADAAGAIRFRFTGRVRRHALKPRRYRLKAVPRNAAGSGRAAYAKFRIKR